MALENTNRLPINWGRVQDYSIYGAISGLVLGTSATLIKGVTYENPWVFQHLGYTRKFGPISFAIPFILTSTSILGCYSLTREVYKVYADKPIQKPHLYYQIREMEKSARFNTIVGEILKEEINIDQLQSKNDSLESELMAGIFTGMVFGTISFRPFIGMTVGTSLAFISFIFRSSYYNYRDRSILRESLNDKLMSMVEKGEIKQIEANEIITEFKDALRGVEYYSSSFFSWLDDKLSMIYEPLIVYRRVSTHEAELVKKKSRRIQEYEYWKLMSKIENAEKNSLIHHPPSELSRADQIEDTKK